ncbi:MAG: hypothetical protein DIU52_012005 [bacterium]|mgnify:FL=1|jgi:hypothetical protein|nr:MAG: hypothetical protein DIU52_11715 [bacterium]
MQRDRARAAAAGALAALGILAACDTEPTEPPYSPSNAAIAFAQFSPGVSLAGDAGEFEHHVSCPMGGSVTFRGSVSLEEEGAVRIRRVTYVRRYEDCGIDRGYRSSSAVTANGELMYDGEMHMEFHDESWPPTVLLQKSRQFGTLTLLHGDEVTECEYDVEQVFDLVAGQYAVTGTACGVPVERTAMGGARVYWRTLSNKK